MREIIDDEEWVRAIIALALANTNLMDGTIQPFKALITGSDVAIAVWPSKESIFGYGLTVVKGQDRLAEIDLTDPDSKCRTTAVACESQEQALSWRRSFGRKNHWSSGNVTRRRAADSLNKDT